MAKKKRITICLFIDAFGWEILKKNSALFLDDVLKVKAPLETVFGYSSTCDPTILTGKLPREHGHFSFFYYNPQQSPFRACRLLAPLPSAITSRGRVRRVMSRLLQKYYGYTGYFQIYNMPFKHLHLFDYSEKKDLYMPGGINGGQQTVFDYLRTAKVPFAVSDWRKNEKHNIDTLAQQLQEGNIEFAYLYLAEMDGILHAQGTNAKAVSDKIAWYDSQVRKLLEIANGKYEEVRLHIFSDHGMTDVRDTCPLMSVLDESKTGLKFGRDYTAVFDSTMARFWFHKPGVQEKIEAALRGVEKGRILTDDDLAQWGCDFPGKKYGELFFLMNPGVLLCPGFMGERPIAGMHGYAPTDANSTAMYASNVVLEKQPRRLTDLFCMMRAEAGV
jgi:predicted AlkP superfamily pyrophosphatase or phosphodiesterase